jgi:hypothetical protein
MPFPEDGRAHRLRVWACLQPRRWAFAGRLRSDLFIGFSFPLRGLLFQKRGEFTEVSKGFQVTGSQVLEARPPLFFTFTVTPKA